MDYNLLATERGVYSLLSASVAAITPIHKSEMGVIRRPDRRRQGNQDKKKTAPGRVDLWCYKDGIEFFLEFKRTYISPEKIIKTSVPGKIKDAWKSLTKQVDDVKRAVRADPRYSNYKGCESSTAFVGMHIITLRRMNTDLSKIKATLAERIVPNDIKSWSKQFPGSIDSIIEWKIGQDEHKFREIDWDDDDEPTQWAAFPRHLFCFNIEFNDKG